MSVFLRGQYLTYSVGDLDERVVDGNNLDVITVDGVTEDLIC